MQAKKLEIDLEALPEEGRRKLVDFYQSLLKKYKGKIRQKATTDVEREILADQIQIDTKRWKFKRDEIHER